MCDTDEESIKENYSKCPYFEYDYMEDDCKYAILEEDFDSLVLYKYCDCNGNTCEYFEDCREVFGWGWSVGMVER